MVMFYMHVWYIHYIKGAVGKTWGMWLERARESKISKLKNPKKRPHSYSAIEKCSISRTFDLWPWKQDWVPDSITEQIGHKWAASGLKSKMADTEAGTVNLKRILSAHSTHYGWLLARPFLSIYTNNSSYILPTAPLIWYYTLCTHYICSSIYLH